MRFTRAELTIGERLGAGSQGVIYRVRKGHGLGLPFEALIFKEFSPGIAVSGAALEHLSRFRDGLDDPGRRLIDAMTVWPLAIVEDDGRSVGYLMQEIPAPFLQPITTMAGSETIPREVQHLFVSDALARRTLGETANRLERLAVARELAFVLGFLHRQELVFGDLSYKNAVYTLRPRPTVMLLDCDAVRARGQGSAVAQLHSPGWAPPEKGPQTIATDRYKLGLFVLRALTPGVNAQNRDPAKAEGALDREGMALLRRALAADPAERTSGREWVEYLDKAIAGAGGVKPRTGWVPRPEPPARRARPGELAAPHRTGVPAATRAVTAPARAARVAVPAAASGPVVRGQRVRPGHVRSFRPAAGTGASGVATGQYTPPPTFAGSGLAFRLSVGILFVFVGIVLSAVLSGVISNAGGPTATTGPPGGQSSTVAPVATVPGGAVALSGAADEALAGSRRATPGGLVPVAISLNGTLGAPVDPVIAVPLSRTPSRWVVESVPASALEPGDAPVAYRTVVAQSGSSTLQPQTEPPATTPVGARRFVALPDDTGVRLDRLASTAAGRWGTGTNLDYGWVCPAVADAVDDCRWRIGPATGATVAERAWSYVSADGTAFTDPPAWTA